MLDTVFATVFVFIILSLIGLGPALLFFKRNFSTAVMTAPVFGFMLTTIVTTYLVLWDFPINQWASAWMIAGIVLSALITFFSAKKIVFEKSVLSFYCMGWCLTTLIILLPVMLYGLSFTVLRGNGTDTFNYLTTAGYLGHEHYSMAHRATLPELINKQPAYLYIKDLLIQRWSTPALLSFSAQIAHISPLRFEYGFTALFFMMAFGAALQLMLNLSFSLRFALLIALAICVGFWAQFVMDIRAMSQISSIPCFLLFALQLSELENHPQDFLKQFGLGMTAAVLALSYVELLPLVILGTLLFFTKTLWNQKNTLKSLIQKYGFSLLIFAAILLPIFSSYLLNFLISQSGYALTAKNSWDRAYFFWLYHHSLVGFWGFSFVAFFFHPFWFLNLPLVLLSATLSLIFIYSLIKMIFTKKISSPSAQIITAFLLASIIEFSFLLLKDQKWAAGKALSYGYPFLLTFISAAGLIYVPQWIRNRSVIAIAKYSVLTFLILQIGLGVFRVGFGDRIYPRYIGFHGEYNQHDWNIDPLTDGLKQNHIHTVGLALPNYWSAKYFALAWGWDYELYDLTNVLTGDHVIQRDPPAYQIVLKTDPIVKQAKILAENHEFALIRR